METRSNYILVGAVTLAMLAGLLVFTVWLAGLGYDVMVHDPRGRMIYGRLTQEF